MKYIEKRTSTRLANSGGWMLWKAGLFIYDTVIIAIIFLSL